MKIGRARTKPTAEPPVPAAGLAPPDEAPGHVVGFLGDGVNDAPSLHAADVGISVSSAVEIAREAAEVILLERSLRVLHEGILEGRKSFGNVMKYLLMGTSSDFGNMFSMAVAPLFLPYLPMLPTQILLNNFHSPRRGVKRRLLRRPRFQQPERSIPLETVRISESRRASRR